MPQSNNSPDEQAATSSWYALGVLTIVYSFNYLDRQIMAILIEPIKAEFGVSDTAMGLLTGLAFVVFYATLGVPVARLADRYNRRNIIAIAVALWSAATALCAAVGNYSQLLVARMAVGVGESGGTPPSHSMLADLFPPHRRSTAMGIFNAGTNIGQLIALIGGAWVASEYGWRAAFVFCGLPGLLLALIVRFTLKEPQRGRFEATGHTPPQTSIAEQLRELPLFFREQLWHNRAMRALVLLGGIFGFTGYAFGMWAVPFLQRVHGMSLTMAGTTFAFSNILVGMVGMVIGGMLCDRLCATRGKRWQFLTPALGLALGTPCTLLFLLWPEQHQFTIGGTTLPVAMFWLLPAALFASWVPAAMFTAVQNLMRPDSRATAIALHLLVMNLLGLGLGPLFTGVVNDLLAAELGQMAIRYSLSAGALFNVFAVLLLLRYATEYQRQMERAAA